MLLDSYSYIYSSSSAGTNAWRRCLKTNDPKVGRYNTFPKEYAFSVRCVLGIDSVTVSSEMNKNEINNISFYYYDNTVFVKYSLTAPGNLNLQVADLTGRILFSTAINSRSGNGTESIRIPGLATGIYILMAQSGPYVQTGKFIVP